MRMAGDQSFLNGWSKWWNTRLDGYWGLERARLRWVAMKWGLEMREHHVLKTHLNLITDFTGSRDRISVITSFGRLFDIVLLFPGTEEKMKKKTFEREKSFFGFFLFFRKSCLSPLLPTVFPKFLPRFSSIHTACPSHTVQRKNQKQKIP
jgi:hypothetical protein